MSKYSTAYTFATDDDGILLSALMLLQASLLLPLPTISWTALQPTPPPTPTLKPLPQSVINRMVRTAPNLSNESSSTSALRLQPWLRLQPPTSAFTLEPSESGGGGVDASEDFIEMSSSPWLYSPSARSYNLFNQFQKRISVGWGETKRLYKKSRDFTHHRDNKIDTYWTT